MNTLLFLCGGGVGTLLATLVMLFVINALSRSGKKSYAFHRDMIELHTERNRLVRLQLQSVCSHRDVTVVENGGRCDRCGADVNYDKETSNWK